MKEPWPFILVIIFSVFVLSTAMVRYIPSRAIRRTRTSSPLHPLELLDNHAMFVYMQEGFTAVVHPAKKLFSTSLFSTVGTDEGGETLFQCSDVSAWWNSAVFRDGILYVGGPGRGFVSEAFFNRAVFAQNEHEGGQLLLEMNRDRISIYLCGELVLQQEGALRRMFLTTDQSERVAFDPIMGDFWGYGLKGHDQPLRFQIMSASQLLYRGTLNTIK